VTFSTNFFGGSIFFSPIDVCLCLRLTLNHFHPLRMDNVPNLGVRSPQKKKEKVHKKKQARKLKLYTDQASLTPHAVWRDDKEGAVRVGDVGFCAKPLVVLDMNGVLVDRLEQGAVKSEEECDGFGGGRGFNVKLNLEFLSRIMEKVRRRAAGLERSDRILPIRSVQLVASHSHLSLRSLQFAVAVWSSADKKVVRKLLFEAYGEELVKKFVFIWGRERCQGDTQQMGGENTLRKPLRRVHNAFPGLYSEINCVLVDDSVKKVLEGDRHIIVTGGMDMESLETLLEEEFNV